MKINTVEMVDEYRAVERWENEGGRVSYAQLGLGTGVIKQAARQTQTMQSRTPWPPQLETTGYQSSPYYFHASPDYSNARRPEEPTVT